MIKKSLAIILLSMVSLASFAFASVSESYTLDENDYEMALKDINENVFNYFKYQTKITLGEPTFEKANNGKYNMSVPVSWNLKETSVVDVLNRYFNLSESNIKNEDFGNTVPHSIGISAFDNDDKSQKLEYSNQLLAEMVSYIIAIEVDTGFGKGYLPLSAHTGGMIKHIYAFQFANNATSNLMLEPKYSNPIIIKGITEREFKKIGKPSVSVVILDSNKLQSWRYQ